MCLAPSVLPFDIDFLRTQVIATYDQVARQPNAHYHFHRGPDYARDFLGFVF